MIAFICALAFRSAADTRVDLNLRNIYSSKSRRFPVAAMLSSYSSNKDVQAKVSPSATASPLGASDILSLITPLGKIYRTAMATGVLPNKDELRPIPAVIPLPGAWQAYMKTREEKMMQKAFESCPFKTVLSTIGGNVCVLCIPIIHIYVHRVFLEYRVCYWGSIRVVWCQC